MSYTEQIRLAGEEWSRLNGVASLLEEMQKSVLAEIFNQSEGSAAAREQEARAHPSYREHVKKMVGARTEANLAKVRWEARKLQLEEWRTRESSKRAEMQNLGR